MDKGKIEKYFFREIIFFLIYLGIYFPDDKRLFMYIHTRIRHSRTTPRKISTHHCCCFTVLQSWVKMSLSLDYLFPLVDFLHFETNMKQCVHFKSMCSNVFLTRSLWFSLSSLLLLIDSKNRWFRPTKSLGRKSTTQNGSRPDQQLPSCCYGIGASQIRALDSRRVLTDILNAIFCMHSK